VPFGGAVLLCAKTRWFPTSPFARAIRTLTKRGSDCRRRNVRRRRSVWSKRAFKRCRSVVLGSTGLRDAEAPRIPVSPWALPRGCARRNRSRRRKTSAATNSSTLSARWARALRGSATPRIARDFTGRGPIGPFFQTRRTEGVESGDRRAPSLHPETEQAVARARLVRPGEPKRQSELPHCKQQGGEKGEGFFRLLARSRPKPQPPASSPKTRR
jgi:hypothetical protein